MQVLKLCSRWIQRRAFTWVCLHGVLLLRVSLGVVFLWFGILKFFPNLSPAQDLAVRTIAKLTWGVIPASISLFVLAIWECIIGIGILFDAYPRTALLLLFCQMSGTLTSLFFFPQEMFTFVPYAPTLEGQYVIKNLILISAGVVVGSTLPSHTEATSNTELAGMQRPSDSHQRPQWRACASPSRRQVAGRST